MLDPCLRHIGNGEFSRMLPFEERVATAIAEAIGRILDAVSVCKTVSGEPHAVHAEGRRPFQRSIVVYNS